MPCLIVFSPKIRLDKIVCLHCVCIRVRVCLYFVHLVVFAVCGYLDGTEKTHTLTQYKETKKIQRFYSQPMGDSIFGSKYDFSFWNYAEPAQEWKAILFFSAFSRVVLCCIKQHPCLMHSILLCVRQLISRFSL